MNRLVNAQEELNGETMLSSVDSFVKLIASFYINVLDNLSIDIAISSREAQLASVYEIFAGSIEKNVRLLSFPLGMTGSNVYRTRTKGNYETTSGNRW